MVVTKPRIKIAATLRQRLAAAKNEAPARGQRPRDAEGPESVFAARSVRLAEIHGPDQQVEPERNGQYEEPSPQRNAGAQNFLERSERFPVVVGHFELVNIAGIYSCPLPAQGDHQRQRW